MNGETGGLLSGLEPRILLAITCVILSASLIIRVLVIPYFTVIPGHFQLILEQMVTGVDRAAGFLRGVTGIVPATRRGAKKAWKALAKFGAEHRRELMIWLGTAAVLLILSMLVPASHSHQDVQTAMRDAVLHDTNQISLFGLKQVNPGLIAAMTVTGILLCAALLIRIFLIPNMKVVPGKAQLVLEQIVDLLDGLSKSRGKLGFIGAYVFAAGVYIFAGTIFELFGLQALASSGASVTLPAPLSDINAAIGMGCLSYLVILGGGIYHAGVHGLKATLKEFSLPISMSFRLFGALLSGLLVTDLVYHYAALRYGVPVIIGVVFTLLHAIVQSYVLTMLVGMYYAEVSETEAETDKT